MCGICGEIRFDGQAADVGAVARMTGAMTARGPDADGVVAHGPVAFGHRRLAIIDLSARGAQPMVDSDLGLTLVFNGCIYNYQELRNDLQAAGYRFFSTADSEVVIKAFHKWGVHSVERFKGMFAFAIADRDTGVVTLARDRLGIKPLYLASSPGRLRFASTVRALLKAGGVDTELDRQALHHYMTFHSVVPAPRTVYRGVRKLPPATVRVIQPDGSHADTVYWDPDFRRDPDKASWSAGDWQAALMDALRAGVKRRMVADVPVGVLLSGGIDSSVVVALLAEQGQHGLATFSIGFDSAEGESGDEYFYSDLVAKTFDTDHHKIHIDSSLLIPAVPKTIAAMNEPMVSHDCVAFYLLSEQVSKSVKVVQSGQGADEILAGYSWYPPLANIAREQTTEAYAKVFFDRDHEDVLSIFSPEYGIDDDVSREFAAGHQGAPGADSAVDAALRLDTQVMLVDDPVKRVDSMTMAWGLEARVPFLDHDFVELAGACPPELKLASNGKGVLKDASRALLPSEVIDRTKGHFPVPSIRHLRGELLDMVRDAVTNDAARSRGLYRADSVKALLTAPNETRTRLDANTLWQLGVLEMWLQNMEA
ncbi:MAG TPA: N-acetylglutaminylglutamine amidotransferase [Mycobacterium sp.]|jgi:asparagine synthase (glutamine-hydrolysing)|nr:N-acetylglutaminylglutamine amidotransferase [Mycobacterium sp.]